MPVIFIDIDNTLLDFDAYIRQTMAEGFAHFGLRPYEPYMEEVFHRENGKLWHQIEAGTLTFRELEQIRWNNVFRALQIDFDGPVFEKYFRTALYDSAIPVDGAMELLRALHGSYTLAVASNGPYEQQLHRLELAGMKPYFDWFFVSEKLGVSKPAAAFFPALKSATGPGFAAIAWSTNASRAAASDTAPRPRSFTIASGSPPVSKISGSSSFSVGPLIVPASAAGRIAQSPIALPLAFRSAITSPRKRLQRSFAVFLSRPFAAASK